MARRIRDISQFRFLLWALAGRKKLLLKYVSMINYQNCARKLPSSGLKDVRMSSSEASTAFLRVDRRERITTKVYGGGRTRIQGKVSEELGLQDDDYVQTFFIELCASSRPALSSDHVRWASEEVRLGWGHALERWKAPVMTPWAEAP